MQLAQIVWQTLNTTWAGCEGKSTFLCVKRGVRSSAVCILVIPRNSRNERDCQRRARRRSRFACGLPSKFSLVCKTPARYSVEKTARRLTPTVAQCKSPSISLYFLNYDLLAASAWSLFYKNRIKKSLTFFVICSHSSGLYIFDTSERGPYCS